MNRNEIVEQLRNNVCTVTFTKINGEERVMNCTLKEGLVPATQSTTPRGNDNIVNVWNTDINAWRSFRVDTVKEVTANV